MIKVTLKVEIDEEAYKIIMNTSVIANEEMLLKGSAKDLKMTEAMLKFIDAIHETTPLTESDDCVSRQAVIAEMRNLYPDIPFVDFNNARLKWTRKYKPYLDCEEVVKSMPSVLPKREQGEWIGDKAYPICPKCNCNIIEEYISCSDYAEMYKPMKYCPNCGAEMR